MLSSFRWDWPRETAEKRKTVKIGRECASWVLLLPEPLYFTKLFSGFEECPERCYGNWGLCLHISDPAKVRELKA
jgi:hypothetical protein